MAMLEAKGLFKAFGKTQVLQDIHLAVNAGEFVCLLGPSGCGKTTLLRILCGIERPTGGLLFFDDQEITQQTPQQRRFGVVFQSYALFPNLTAEDNVRYGLQRLSPTQQAERAREMLALVGLSDFLKRYPAQLSGGQQQRVALARALAPSPRLLLLDEPLSALDAKVREGLRHEIVSIQRSLRIPTIMVTHDQEEALEMADRVVLMSDGRIAQDDCPETLYRAPQSRFSAQFVGRANFIRASVHHDTIRLNGISVPAGSIQGLDKLSSPSFLFMVRPERIAIHPLADQETLVPIPGGHLSVSAVVRGLRFTGAVWRVDIQCPLFEGPASADLLNLGDMGAIVKVGLSVRISIPLQALQPIPDTDEQAQSEV
nr:Spermidine/putrescine import ATP-binding protein PotA [Cupriavidus sp.]